MSEEGGGLRKRFKGKPVEFNRDSLKDFVTGFAKRKQQRREYGAIQLAKKQRIERNAARKERRDAMKIQDRVTGAFGDKLSDDSDDELGDGQKGLEMGFPKKDGGKKAAAAPAAKKQAVHEDEVAVVTVMTREHDSDEEDDEDVSDDDEDDLLMGEDDPAEGQRTGIPFLRRDGTAAPAAAAAGAGGSASTPYNPNKSQQDKAVQKAKNALKAKDKARAKGMSAKGGHKYKKAKIQSKKKKVKFGNKKGANRDK